MIFFQSQTKRANQLGESKTNDPTEPQEKCGNKIDWHFLVRFFQPHSAWMVESSADNKGQITYEIFNHMTDSTVWPLPGTDHMLLPRSPHPVLSKSCTCGILFDHTRTRWIATANDNKFKIPIGFLSCPGADLLPNKFDTYFSLPGIFIPRLLGCFP